MLPNQMQIGMQSSVHSTSDKQNQFTHDTFDLTQITMFDRRGRPLHKSLLEEIRHKTDEFIKNNINTPDLHSVLDYSTLKLKFTPTGFTDMTIKKYIIFQESGFLADKSKNGQMGKYLITFSCFQGPVFFFLKKVMANFDFKSPFNMVDAGQSGVENEYVNSNGAQQNVLNPLYCPQSRLEMLKKQAQIKNSKLIFQSDPLGTQLTVHEAIFSP